MCTIANENTMKRQQQHGENKENVNRKTKNRIDKINKEKTFRTKNCCEQARFRV